MNRPCADWQLVASNCRCLGIFCELYQFAEEPIVQPQNIIIDESRSFLRIEWSDGRKVELTAPSLRDLCQSAKSKRLAVQGLSVPAAEDLKIEDASLIGRYGINIVFSDGHDRGIYPWVMLREYAVMQSGDKKAFKPAINCGSTPPGRGSLDPTAQTATANGD